MRIFVTGHRPDKLGGYSDKARKSLEEFCYEMVLARQDASVFPPTEQPTYLIGMAQGFDQAMATACIELGAPWEAYVPFMGQESKWPSEAQARYWRLLDMASHVHYLHDTKPVAPKQAVRWLLERNTRMVLSASEGIALYNGTGGGTGHAVKVARLENRPVTNWWSDWERWLQK